MQEVPFSGPCIACVFPDMVSDDRYPCPGTPAIADILQAVGALVVYAVDSILMERPRGLSARTRGQEERNPVIERRVLPERSTLELFLKRRQWD